MEKKGIHQRLKTILTLIILLGVAGYGMTRLQDEEAGYKSQINNYRKTIQRLSRVVKQQDSIHRIESKLRKEQREVDSVRIVTLNRLKKLDSTTYIYKISVILKKQKELTEQELDEKVNKIYHEATGN